MAEISLAFVTKASDSVALRFAKSRTAVAGAMVTALVTFCFFMLFWNRFIGLRSGDGGFSGGLFFLKGILPYRDYYGPTPPLFLFRSAAALAIFGKLPIVIRAFGVFERLLLSLLVYGWLVRFFRVKDAALAALTTMVVSAGDYADPISSYNHFTIMLAVASGLVASYALDQGRSKRFLLTIGCLTGVLSQLCLDSKQTIGLGVTFAIPVVVGLCLLRLEGVRKAVQFLVGFAGGWVVATAILVGWMAQFGILQAFLRQIFIEGPAAKASHPGDFLLHTVLILKGLWWAALIASIVLALSWKALRWSETKEGKDTQSSSLSGILLALLLGLGSIGASWALPLTWNYGVLKAFSPQMAAKPMIYVAFVGSALLLPYYLWCYLSRTLARRQAQFALFAAVAFTVAFMTSLSFPAFEAMTVPGLALILAVLLNYLEDWRRILVYSACGLLLFCGTQFKEKLPFGFEGFLEPPVEYATATSSLPELRGFLLPRETIDFVDSTIRIVNENSSAKDTIFTYPELGLFYGATERMPATFSGSHNLDVVPDAFARKEAERLLQARPAVLIYAPRPEQLAWEESFWRNGQPSGQRDLIAAVETLARQYTLVRTFKLYPFRYPVYVFVRP